MITAELKGATIRIKFQYDKALVMRVHQIVDVRWNRGMKYWYCPASPWHAELIFKVFPEIRADKYVLHLARVAPYFRVLSSAKDHPKPEGGLYPYQMAGVEYIEASNGHALVADSTGTGKTVVVLHWAKTKGDAIETMLVVCPGGIRHKWVAEINRWYDPTTQPVIVDSPYLPASPIHVMSYDRMRILSSSLYTRKYDLMILDELQAVKNPKSQRGSVARKIAEKSKYVIGISATPSPNRPMELFNELHTIRPWEYPSSWTFGGRYAGGPYQSSAFKGNSHTEELKDRLTSIMIRRKKADVLNQLPSITRSVMWIDLPEDDAVFYNRIKYETRQAIMAMNPSHKGYFANVLDKITGLRQAVGIAKSGVISEFINDLLEEDENSKVVVSCHFMKTIDSINAKLNSEAAVLTGSTNEKDREIIKDVFRNPGGPRVLLMSSVGTEGIDLFGVNGVDISNIVIADRQWTPAPEEQAEGRLHRIGQSFAVTSHYFNANRTIDVYMSNIVEDKRRVGLETANQGEIVREIVKGLLEEDDQL